MDLRAQPPLLLEDRTQLRQLQLDDPGAGPKLRDLECSPNLGSDASPSPSLVVNDGLLYYRGPKHKRNLPGHLGIAKTLARMQSRFYWPKMASEVKRYVLSCPVCQLTKPSQRKPAGFMVPISPQRPWEYAGVDFVGPLPRTASGNSYILVFVDYFSKWIEVCAVRDATARVAASKFINEVFARHGAPRYLISDRGSPFVSELFDSVLSTLGSTHRLTTAYHPQTNATERVNRTLKTAIRAYVGDKHASWDKFMSQICFALRSAPHESTGLSPAMMLYGRELETPLDLLTKPSGESEESSMPYPETLKASLQEAHDRARETLARSHARQKRYYDLRCRPHRCNGLAPATTDPRPCMYGQCRAVETWLVWSYVADKE
uniref:Gypsy retrotransposon integrase-like protein 1 n=1 Tax=Astatotilapia calliptera TaxID=8154 RepID=A0A3P8NJ88_ASTCA